MEHLVLTDDNFKTEVLEAKELVVVDFWAIWCYPCRMLMPVIDEIAKEYEEKIKVGKVDIDACPKISSEYGIQSIPTIIFFKGGKMVESLSAVRPKEEYVNVIKMNI
ncbi:thioredoxin [Candidatus Dojkabacteria bacterium]|jgi:thioredoxin 1|nr:thioredoxin [Candidatus Dojkabacteria bacterium]